jgi:hypothetical protein
MTERIPASISILQRPSHWKNDRSGLFKFTTRATGRIVLEKMTLRWSRPGHLNDPHDNQFHLLPVFDYGEAKRRGLEKLWQAHYDDAPIDPRNALGRIIRANRGRFPAPGRDEFVDVFGDAFDEVFSSMPATVARFNAEVQEQMATNKILCLTECVEETRMWAHYAEGHKGIAFRFRAIPELDSMFGIAEPVTYQDAPPALCDVEYFSDIMSGRRSLEVKTILDAMVFVKSRAWEYEKEWRVFGGSGWQPEQDFEDIRFNRAELDAVVLGCKMPEEDVATFKRLIGTSYPSARIYSAAADRDAFSLSFKEVASRARA